MTPLFSGLGVTLQLFAWTLLLSIPLGFLICFGRISKLAPLRWFTQGYILLFRGTPLLLQLIFWFFGLPILGIKVTREMACIIAFALNYAAYFAEIFRAGIQSIPRGQHEAAFILGLNKKQLFFLIELPQVTKNVLPPVGNEVVTLVKDTALVYAVAISDLLREAQKILMRVGTDLTPLIVAGVFYLIMTSLLTWLFNYVEKRMSYYRI